MSTSQIKADMEPEWHPEVSSTGPHPWAVEAEWYPWVVGCLFEDKATHERKGSFFPLPPYTPRAQPAPVSAFSREGIFVATRDDVCKQLAHYIETYVLAGDKHRSCKGLGYSEHEALDVRAVPLATMLINLAHAINASSETLLLGVALVDSIFGPGERHEECLHRFNVNSVVAGAILICSKFQSTRDFARTRSIDADAEDSDNEKPTEPETKESKQAKTPECTKKLRRVSLSLFPHEESGSILARLFNSLLKPPKADFFKEAPFGMQEDALLDLCEWMPVDIRCDYAPLFNKILFGYGGPLTELYRRLDEERKRVVVHAEIPEFMKPVPMPPVAPASARVVQVVSVTSSSTSSTSSSSVKSFERVALTQSASSSSLSVRSVTIAATSSASSSSVTTTTSRTVTIVQSEKPVAAAVEKNKRFASSVQREFEFPPVEPVELKHKPVVKTKKQIDSEKKKAADEIIDLTDSPIDLTEVPDTPPMPRLSKLKIPKKKRFT